MPISYVGGRGAGRTNANSTVNIAINSGLNGGSGTAALANDLVVVTVVVGSQARNPSCAVSGYTALSQQNVTPTTYDTSVCTSYKFMPSTPDTTVTIPACGNNADGQGYTIQVYRGVDQTVPLDGVTPIYSTGNATNNNPDPSSITPATAGAWIYFGGGGAAADGSTVFTASYLSGFLSYNGSDTNDGTVGSGHYTSWSSGGYDGAAYGGGNTNNANSWACTALVLRPILVNFTHQGAIYGTESTVSTRTVEKVFGSALAEERTWDSDYEKGSSSIDFTHQSNLVATQTYVSTKTKEALVQGAIYSTQTLISDKTAEHLVAGALAQAKTFVSEKTMEYHAVEGTLSQTLTQSHRVSGNIALSPSDNVTDGEATTFQLTPPAGKATTDFVAGKLSDETNPVSVTITSDNYTELEWSLRVNAEKDEVFDLRVTDNGTPITEATTPTYTVGQVDFTHQGAISATQTLASTRTIEKQYTGTLTAVETLQATRAIERVWNSTLQQTDTWNAQLLRDKLFLGTLAATQTWTSEKQTEHLIQGALSQQKYLSHTRETEHLVQGALNAEQTWDSDIYFDTAAVNFLHNGALDAVQTWTSTKIIEAVINGTLTAEQTWASPWTKTLDFLHDGALLSERLLTTLRTIEKVYVGSTYRESAWSHDKTKEALIQALLSQTVTWRGDRTIERVIEGGLGDTETWVSDFYKIIDFAHAGTLSKEQTWASLRSIQKVVQGTLAQEKTYNSIYTKEGSETVHGTLSSERTWSHTVSKDARTLLIHIGNISGSRTWASAAMVEHLIVGDLSQEMFLRQFTPFSYEWTKDSGVDTVWVNKDAPSSTWVKRDLTADGWDKRGKAR